MTHSTQVHRPRTIDEARAVLAEHGASARLIAGGTDLMVLLNARLLEASEFIDLGSVPELRGIDDLGETMRIGATVTYTQLISSPLVNHHAPSLIAASRTIGAVQIQNRGTLGGNIANASPAADTLPVLAAFDAEIEIDGPRGSRLISIHSFYSGYRRTVLAADEMIVAVHLPKLRDGERDFFHKVGTRRAQSISKVMLGARIRMSRGPSGDLVVGGLVEGDFIEGIALSYGSVAPTVIRARHAEAVLKGQPPTPELITQAIEALDEDLHPISDLRSTAEYRRRIAGNLLARLFRQSPS